MESPCSKASTAVVAQAANLLRVWKINSRTWTAFLLQQFSTFFPASSYPCILRTSTKQMLQIAAAGSLVQQQREARSPPEPGWASATFLGGGHDEGSQVPLFQLRAAVKEQRDRLQQLQPHRTQQSVQTQDQARVMVLDALRAMAPSLSQGLGRNPFTTNNDRIRSVDEDNPRSTNKKRKQNRTPYRCK